ncbi:MAG TPA: ketoacyl-ACP synthase III [Chitinophagaceae bacterium]|nr:ketoacyl-ACP synthase III [Chitinophagaceae bacterium]
MQALFAFIFNVTMQTVIIGSGSFIPCNIKTNSCFTGQCFYDDQHRLINQQSGDIIAKFQQITGIAERRYVDEQMNASGMAALAGARAIEDAGIDAETIDQVIVAHNFGDTACNAVQGDMVPSLASRVKHKLGIKNPACVAYDLLFGCPGWLQGLIQADAFGKAGMAKTCLIIGTETLSRVIDIYDRDSMIFSDGAGAVVTVMEENGGRGIIGSKSASYACEDIGYITMGQPNFQLNGSAHKYLKMQGRKVYEFALKEVPAAIKNCLEQCNADINEVKKIFIHQANEKMDEAIVERLFKLYGIKNVPQNIMPMNIQTLGNSSVATIPTLYDMVRKQQLAGHTIYDGDVIVFASVGAGMNINAVCYKV